MELARFLYAPYFERSRLSNPRHCDVTVTFEVA